MIGGSGQVGRLFAALLAEAPGARDGSVVCLDPVPPAAGPVPDGAATPGPRWLRGDIRAPDDATAELIASADVLVAAVPEPVALAALPVLSRHMKPGALFVDTLSVKTRICALVRDGLAGRPALSLNPMFAPALGFAGRVVAAVTLSEGPGVDEVLGLVRAAGAQVVAVSAEEHDRVTAVTQAATHAAVLAFGLAAARLGVDIGLLRALAPPPHETLLALLARIVSGAPEVYWDIQEGNPRAAAARDGVRQGVEHICGVRDETEFAAMLEGLRDFLGEPGRGELADRCQTLFSSLGPGPAAAH